MALIQVRRDTATAWTSANTVLATGEIGFETDTLKFKIGNGTAWNALPYGVPTTTATNNTWTGTNTFSGNVTVNSTLALNSNLVTAPKIQSYTESATIPTISSGNLTLNLANGNVFGPVALNAAISNMTFTGLPASGTAASWTLLLKANGTAVSVTWPAAVLWAGGTAPTITSTANKTDAFTFVTVDGGTTVLGFKAGQNF